MRLLADDHERRFLVPDEVELNPGPLKVDQFGGEPMAVLEAEVLPYLCTEQDAASHMAQLTNAALEAALPSIEAFASAFANRSVRLNDLLKDRRFARQKVLAGMGRAGMDPESMREEFVDAARKTKDPQLAAALRSFVDVLAARTGHGPPLEDDEE